MSKPKKPRKRKCRECARLRVYIEGCKVDRDGQRAEIERLREDCKRLANWGCEHYDRWVEACRECERLRDGLALHRMTGCDAYFVYCGCGQKFGTREAHINHQADAILGRKE